MCGRFVIISPPEALRQLFGYSEQPNMPPQHNIAPTQPVPVVIVENGARHFPRFAHLDNIELKAELSGLPRKLQPMHLV